MPQILRKSLTAWLACPAEPPTPRMNSRPPPPASDASPCATASTDAASMAFTARTVSSRNSWTKLAHSSYPASAASRWNILTVSRLNSPRSLPTSSSFLSRSGVTVMM